MYDKYVKNKLDNFDLLAAEFRFTIPRVKLGIITLCLCCRKTGSYDGAVKALKKFPYIELIMSDQKFVLRLFLMYLQMMDKTDFSPLPELYDKLDDHNKQLLIKLVLWQVISAAEQESAVENLRKTVRGDKRLEDMVRVYYHCFVNRDLTAEAVKKYISDHGTKGSENIPGAMMKANLDITPFITADDFDPKLFVRTIYQDSHITTPLFLNYDINAISPEGLERAARVYGWAMLTAHDKKENALPLLEKYGKLGARWFEKFPESTDIPGDIKAALVINTVFSARKDGNYELCESELNRLAAEIPPFAPIINAFADSIRQDIDIEMASSEFELEMQAEEFKRDIRDALDLEDFDEARALIAELEKYVPDDPELHELKEQLPPVPRTGAAAEFAALAAQVKQNIKALITAGEFDQAQALITEYEQLCPGDPETDGLKARLIAET